MHTVGDPDTWHLNGLRHSEVMHSVPHHHACRALTLIHRGFARAFADVAGVRFISTAAGVKKMTGLGFLQKYGLSHDAFSLLLLPANNLAAAGW